MKHNVKVTLLLVLFFVLSQVVGLYILQADIILTTEDGQLKISHSETAVGARPDIGGFAAFMYLLFAIAAGTILFLLIIKLKKFGPAIWKLWFFTAVWITCAISLGVFISQNAALTFGFIIAAIKIFKRNILTHNISEIIMYAGIALLIVPILNILWMCVILVLISCYDMYAVWKSKHMVEMAKFQTKQEVFAGFFIPYTNKEKISSESDVSKEKKSKTNKAEAKAKASKRTKKVDDDGKRTAILGGGDITFPLLFSGVVMEYLITQYNLTVIDAFFRVLLITLTVSIALLSLFMYSKKNRYYPAMPFLSAGCFLGLGLVYLTTLFL